MEWIACKDQMPKIGEPCLLYETYPKGTMFHCRADPLPINFIEIGGLRYNGKFVAYHDQYSEKGLEYVSHWMPLPLIPKE